MGYKFFYCFLTENAKKPIVTTYLQYSIPLQNVSPCIVYSETEVLHAYTLSETQPAIYDLNGLK